MPVVLCGESEEWKFFLRIVHFKSVGYNDKSQNLVEFTKCFSKIDIIKMSNLVCIWFSLVDFKDILWVSAQLLYWCVF